MERAARMIFVTGATGRQGGAVARHLLEDGWRVRALTRDPSQPAAEALRRLGAEVVQGDLDDPESYASHVAGVYGVFSVQNYWEHGFEVEVQEGKGLADVASQAGVTHFVYDSVGGADRDTGIPHFESKWQIEQYVRDLDLPRTIFRPAFFMDNLLGRQYREQILGGTLAMGLYPDATLQMIAVDDIGAFVALAFSDPERYLRQEIEIAGDEVTGVEAAQILAEALHRPVQYAQILPEQLREEQSEDRVKMLDWFNRGGYQADIIRLRQIYPRLKDLRAWAEQANWE